MRLNAPTGVHHIVKFCYHTIDRLKVSAKLSLLAVVKFVEIAVKIYRCKCNLPFHPNRKFANTKAER